MEGFKGTSGPWEAVRISRGDDLKVIVKGSLHKQPGMKIYSAITDEIENKHNALLIAAAPELLEALQEMVAIVKKHTYPQPDKPSSTWGRMEAAEAVIAKALGQ